MLQLETVVGVYAFHSYAKDHVQLIEPVPHSANSHGVNPPLSALKKIETACIVYKTQLITEELSPLFSNFNETTLDRLLKLDADVYLVGTGDTARFPPAELLKHIRKNKITVDFMDTGAACRTYNILASEGRPVAALIYLEQ